MGSKEAAFAALARARAGGSRFIDDEAACSGSDSGDEVLSDAAEDSFIVVDGEEEDEVPAAASFASSAGADSAGMPDSFVGNDELPDRSGANLFAPMEGADSLRCSYLTLKGHDNDEDFLARLGASFLSTISRRDRKRYFVESKAEGADLKAIMPKEIRAGLGYICGEFKPPDDFPIFAIYDDDGNISIPDDEKNPYGSFAASAWNNRGRGIQYLYECYQWYLTSYFAQYSKPQVFRRSYKEGFVIYPDIYCRLAMQFENGAGLRMQGGFEAMASAVEQFCAIAENVLASSIGVTTNGDKAFFTSRGSKTASSFRIFKQGNILTVVFDNIIVPAKILPFYARNFDVLLDRIRASDTPANLYDRFLAFFGTITHNTLRPAWDLPRSTNCLWVHRPGVLLARVIDGELFDDTGLIYFVFRCSRADFAEQLLAHNPDRQLEEWDAEDWNDALGKLGLINTNLRTIWYAMRARFPRIAGAIVRLFAASMRNRYEQRGAAVNWALRVELALDTSILVVMTDSIFDDEGKLPHGMVIKNFDLTESVGTKLAVPDGFNPDSTYLAFFPVLFNLETCLLDICYDERPMFNAARVMNTVRILADIFSFSAPEKMQLCMAVCSIFFVMGPGGKAISTEHMDDYAPWLTGKYWCAIVQRPFSQTALPLSKMSFTRSVFKKNKKGELEEKEETVKIIDIFNGAYASIGVAPNIFSVRDNDAKTFRQCIDEQVVNTAVPPNPIHGDIPEFYKDFPESLRLEMNDLLNKLVTIVAGNRDGSGLRKNWTKGAAVWQVANLMLFVLKAQYVSGRNEKVAWLWSEVPGVMKSTVIAAIAAIFRTTTITYSKSSDESGFDSDFPARLRVDDDKDSAHGIKERAQSGPAVVAKNRKFQGTSTEVDRESLLLCSNNADCVEFKSYDDVFQAIARRLLAMIWGTLLTNRDWINSFREACEAHNYRAFRALLIYFRDEPGFFDRMIPTTIETLWALGHKINKKKGVRYPGAPYMAVVYLVHLQGFSFPKYGNRMFYYLKMWLSQGKDNSYLPHPNAIPVCVLKKMFMRWNFPFLKDARKSSTGKGDAWKEFKRILMLFSDTTWYDWSVLKGKATMVNADNFQADNFAPAAAQTDDDYKVSFDTDEHESIFKAAQAPLIDAYINAVIKRGTNSLPTLKNIDWWGLSKWLDIDSLAHHRDQSGWVRRPDGIETPLFDQTTGNPMCEWPVAEGFTWDEFQKEFSTVESAEQAARGKKVLWEGLDVTEELSAYRQEGEAIVARKQIAQMMEGGVQLGE